jgi:hypothetical protein
MDTQSLGAAWIYERIRGYCEERANGVGGHYRQSTYMKDFCHIFADAVTGGYCGDRAVQRYRRRCSRLKSGKLTFTDFAVFGEGIKTFLRKNWLKGKNRTTGNEEMVSVLCEWWDAWVFAREHYPRDFYSPRRSSRRVKAARDGWIETGLGPGL